MLIWFGNPALALLVGAAWALTIDRCPVPNASKLGKLSLQTAIVLLGFKLSLAQVVSVSGSTLGQVAAYVIGILVIGYALGLLLRVERVSTVLLAAGTAICGGTAIATLSPILKARAEQTGVAIAIVFVLNAVALLTFPTFGAWLGMSQQEFGLFAALAIHDTSSVVATAAIYGDEAMNFATTTKLGRTLWLIPLVLVASIATQSRTSGVSIPTFILVFLAAATISGFVDLPAELVMVATWLSKALLVAALFFIGCEISRNTLKQIRGKVIVLAVGLWGIAIGGTLLLTRMTL